MSEVGRAAEGTGRSAREVLDAAETLSQQTANLNREVGAFLEGVRAA